MRKLNVIELYAGAGRSSAPFKRWRRANHAVFVDWNDHAKQTFLHNYPDAPYVKRDMSSMTPRKLSNLIDGKAADIILGCPPCQGFSESGKREKSDPRNDHVITFLKLAIAMNPKAIAMENVPLAALSPQFKIGTKLLEEAGYRWTAGVLNAALYGSVQSRHRLVLIAAREDLNVDPALPLPTHLPHGKYFDYASETMRKIKKRDDDFLGKTSSAQRAETVFETVFFDSGKAEPIPTLFETLGDLPALGSQQAEKLNHWSWAHGSKILKAMETVPEGGRRVTKKAYYGAAYARLHRHGLARTITTFFPNAGSGRFWHPTENRALSLREAARIQGFPDSFKFMDGATGANATLVGNALDNALAEATYLAIRRLLD